MGRCNKSADTVDNIGSLIDKRLYVRRGDLSFCPLEVYGECYINYVASYTYRDYGLCVERQCS